MLSVLEILTRRVVAEDHLHPEDTASVLRYFTDFVEGLHQTKEYEFLYPVAAMMDFAGAAEGIGRLIVGQLDTKMLFDSLLSLGDPVALDRGEREVFVKLAQAYASRLRIQMEREDEILVLLSEFLEEEDAREMLEQFAQAEKDQCRPEDWEHEVSRLESVCGH